MMFPIRKSVCPNLSSDQRARRKRDEDLLLIISTVMAVIMLFMGATASMAAPGPDKLAAESVQSEMVYICDSKGATSYHHYKDCKLLAQCKAKVETVKEMSARGEGRDRCDACNKRLKAAKK
jgi:hypothetical protein